MSRRKYFFFFLVFIIVVDIVVAAAIYFIPQSERNSLPVSPGRKVVNNIATPAPAPIQVKPVEWTLMLTGDVIPARVVNQKMVVKQDFVWPLVNIKDVLANADLTVVNLESPLLEKCPVMSTGMTFCGDARFAKALVQAGVDIASLANNHSLNYGWEGISETEKALQAVGIETTGFTTLGLSDSTDTNQDMNFDKYATVTAITQKDAIAQFCAKDISCSRLAVKQVQTIKVGFLGYNGVGQRINRELVKAQIESADKLVDVLVVSVHWGKEYVRIPELEPSLAPDDPKELGKLFIDWGADIVSGNHPHWYQSFDFAQGKDGKYKLIIYAQGNTVFDQEWSQETKRGYLFKLHFVGATLQKDKLEIIPIGLKDYGQAYLLEGEEKGKVIRELSN